jgi:hypothetical protein
MIALMDSADIKRGRKARSKGDKALPINGIVD